MLLFIEGRTKDELVDRVNELKPEKVLGIFKEGVHLQAWIQVDEETWSEINKFREEKKKVAEAARQKRIAATKKREQERIKKLPGARHHGKPEGK
jgi:ribosomal protein L21